MISYLETTLLIVSGLLFLGGIVTYWAYAKRLVKEAPDQEHTATSKED